MRIDEFDVAKGFAIFVVVFVHATFLNLDKLHVLTRELLMASSTLLAPAIAIFFFVSGFLGYRSYVKRKSFKMFESQRLKSILIPYVIWSTIYLLLQIEVGYIIKQPYHFTFVNFAQKYLLGEAFLPFYYIIVLAIFYLLTPIISKMDLIKMKKLLIVLFISGLTVMSLYFVPLYFGKEYVSSLMTYRDPLAWMFFYVWGMYLARNDDIPWRKRPSIKVLILFFVFYALSCVEIISVPKIVQDWESYLILGPAVYVFYVFAMEIYLWLSYHSFRKLKILSRMLSALGKNSFGIYLSHGLVLYSILGIALMFDHNLLNESNFILNATGGIIGLGICYELSQIMNKSTLLRKMLG